MSHRYNIQNGKHYAFADNVAAIPDLAKDRDVQAALQTIRLMELAILARADQLDDTDEGDD